jgi:TonB family protein
MISRSQIALFFAFSSTLAFTQTPPPPQPPAPVPPSTGPVQPRTATSTPAGSVGGTDPLPAKVQGDSPQSAVDRVISMFTPNEAINVEATGKPLPKTGTWGVQVKFPNGMPQACIDNDVPCAVVFYRVPDAKVICTWTMGFVTVVAPTADGNMAHVSRLLLLDENESAARYTLRKGWQPGDKRPQPTVYVRPEYPQIAQQAGVYGVVQVRIEVGPDGSVRSAAGVGGPVMLQKPVIAAVQQWKYPPMTIGGHPTSFRVDEQFRFNAGRPDLGAGLEPNGGIIQDDGNPRNGGGFNSRGANGTSYESCNLATGCTPAASPSPK